MLLYDGLCPICNRAVEWIRRRAKPCAFEFLSCHDPSLAARFPQLSREDCLTAIRLVEPDGRIFAGEEAVPGILARMKGYRVAAAIVSRPGVRALARPLYRWIARNRLRLSGGSKPGNG